MLRVPSAPRGTLLTRFSASEGTADTTSPFLLRRTRGLWNREPGSCTLRELAARSEAERFGDTGAVPYDIELSEVERTLEAASVRLTPITEDDAEEAYALLTDHRLDFLDPDYTPVDIAAERDYIARLRAGKSNDPNSHEYQWAVRSTKTGQLVALLMVHLTVEIELDAHGPPHEVRMVEPTLFVDPDHQRQGYGSAAVRAVVKLAVDRFGVTIRLAKIRWDNRQAQDFALREGLTKTGAGMTPHGYETWCGEIS